MPSRPIVRSAPNVDGKNTATCTTSPTASISTHSVPTYATVLAQDTVVSSSQSSPTVRSPSESSLAAKASLSTGAVLGLAVGASIVIVATLMSFVLWCFCIRRHRSANSQHQLVNNNSPSLPQELHKPSRTNSDLSQWSATSSSSLQPSDPRLRPLILPDMAFPRNKALPPSPVEMAGDIYKGQVAQFVIEVAAVKTPVTPCHPPQLYELNHRQNYRHSKVYEAAGREITISQRSVPEPTSSTDRTNTNATTTTTLSRVEATKRAKELEDMYKEVQISSTPRTPPRFTDSPNKYHQPSLFSSPYQQASSPHLEPNTPSSPLPHSLQTPSFPTSPSPRSESKRLAKPEHISSLDGRIRHVDGVVEFKRMTVKEWRRERGRDRMVGPRKGKERRVLGI